MSIFKSEKGADPLSIFEELCAIPHGSGNTDKISAYCVDFAKRLGLYVRRDDWNNVVIKKPASAGYEKRDPVIIQGHLDMVCEKTADCDIDFEKDGLKLKTDGKYLFADGTTLGGDDGIAVAMALAILADDSIVHPPITVAFTTDEETGMYGAANIDVSDFGSSVLMNVDSENEGVLTVSCAGGVRCESVLRLDSENCTGNVFEITVDGLKGGHSGVEIDKGRLNSNVVAAGLLKKLAGEAGARLVSISGGLKDNAIPCRSSLVVTCDRSVEEIKKMCGSFRDSVRADSDPDIRIVVDPGEADFCRSYKTTVDVAEFLTEHPNGVIKMSEDIKGLVQTSLNIGMLWCEGDKLYTRASVRSSVSAEKNAVAEQIRTLTEAHGGDFSREGDYPAWEYRKNSPLRDCMIRVYERMYGEKPVVEAIHAGLECGLFAGKIDDLDAVSFGPNILDIHTPSERLDIESTKRTFKYICEVLKEL